MKKYIIRALKSHTAYETAIYEVLANSKKEAKQILIDGEEDKKITHIDSWNVDADNYNLIEPETWSIEKIPMNIQTRTKQRKNK